MFDFVHHPLLLKELGSYGFTPFVLPWLRPYLCGRVSKANFFFLHLNSPRFPTLVHFYSLSSFMILLPDLLVPVFSLHLKLFSFLTLLQNLIAYNQTLIPYLVGMHRTNWRSMLVNVSSRTASQDSPVYFKRKFYRYWRPVDGHDLSSSVT